MVGGDGHDSLSAAYGADTLIGGQGRDSLEGGEGDDSLTGDDGADTLSSWKGDDTLQGGSGKDLLLDGGGSNLIDGGDGDDVLDLRFSDAAVSIDLNLQTAQDTGGGVMNTVISVEGVMATSHDDALTGTAGAESLSGSYGDDTLAGGDGDDLLVGGKGRDLLTGGDGADTFVFDFRRDVSHSAASDTIADLDDADTIDLSRIDPGLDPGNQAFTLVDHVPTATGEAALIYDAELGLTHLYLQIKAGPPIDIIIDGDHGGFDNFVL